MKLLNLAGAATVAVLALGAASGAQAAVPACNVATDFSSTPAPTDCSGFFAGNLLNDANTSAQLADLTSIGFTGTAADIMNAVANDKLNGLSGLQTLDFGTPLDGVTFIGVHYGAGQGSPDFADHQDVTAFYRFDFTQPTETVTLNFGASSDAVLYQTGAVPEPATWAVMLLGFGGIGATMRRSRRAAALA